MKFVKVDELPKVDSARHNEHKNLSEYLDAFMKRNIKVAKYNTLEAAYICVRRAARSYGYPITVHKRNGCLYVMRKDM